MAKKVFKSLSELGEIIPTITKQVETPRAKRPRIPIKKQVVTERVNYTPRPTIQTPVISQSELVRDRLREFHRIIDHMEYINGYRIPADQESMMKRIIKQYPSALNTTPVSTRVIPYKSKSFNIPDYFVPQQYRGIGNIDAMFENATDAYLRGAPDLSRQFLSAGLSDVDKIARGFKPTSFKYKPKLGIVPKEVIEAIVKRRGAEPWTVEWLQAINKVNPTENATYLDLYAKHPNYFRQMFDLDGKPIK